MLIFPPALSLCAQSIISFKNTIIQGKDGTEARFNDSPIFTRQYHLNTSYLDSQQLMELTNFFVVHRGNYECFLYLDPINHKASTIIYNPKPDATYQLQHHYSIGSSSYSLPVKHNFNVSSPLEFTDHGNGIISFPKIDPSINEITITFHYYLRVRFLENELTISNNPQDSNIIKIIEVI